MPQLSIVAAHKDRPEYARAFVHYLEQACADIDAALTLVSHGPCPVPHHPVSLPDGEWSRGWMLNEALERAPDADLTLFCDVDIVFRPQAWQTAMATADAHGYAVLGGFGFSEDVTKDSGRWIGWQDPTDGAVYYNPLSMLDEEDIAPESALIDRRGEFHGIWIATRERLAQLRELCGERIYPEYRGWGCEDTQLVKANQLLSDNAYPYLANCWRHLWHPPAPGKPKHFYASRGD